jgi:hypothetical protein
VIEVADQGMGIEPAMLPHVLIVSSKARYRSRMRRRASGLVSLSRGGWPKLKVER